MTAVALSARDLSYTFAGRDEPTLKGIDLDLTAGSWNVLVGASGSGKSTLLRALAGLIPRNASGLAVGQVLVDGLDTRHASPAELAARVGLVLQAADDQLCASTVAGELAFGLENLALPHAEIEGRVARGAAQARLEDDLGRPVEHLSGGQKQRLLLSAILAMRPQVLLLDEPLSQLDPAAAAELLDQLDALRKQGLCIVIVEHRLDGVLTRADRILAMSQGRLARDISPVDAQARLECLSAAGLTPPEELAGSIPSQSAPIDRTPQTLLAVERLTLAYRRGKTVLEDVSFTLRPGERLAIVGANGCGKSTLLAAIAGLLRPRAGRIERPAVPAGQAACGLLMQNPDLTLFCSTVEDELAYGPRQAGCQASEVQRRARAAADELELTDLLGEPPLALSQGQRLRAALGAVLTLHPRVLLLDEPTTGQDPLQRQRILRIVAERARTGGSLEALVFSSHDLQSVGRLASRVLVLAGGRVIADGATEAILSDLAVLRAAGLCPTGAREDRP